MPKSWRTDTFMSGMPGTPAWAWAGMSFRFRMFFQVLGRQCRTGSANDRELPSVPASDEASLLQIVISLDDFAQLVLGPLVAAIGVGVVALDQLLEPGLDLGTRRRLPADRGLPAISAPAA